MSTGAPFIVGSTVDNDSDHARPVSSRNPKMSRPHPAIWAVYRGRICAVMGGVKILNRPRVACMEFGV
jgi:hypothetical protein